MRPGALRVGAAVFVVGLLFVWLIRPIGDACPDLGKLPAGSRASSGPSFGPPLTRTCTYTTADGTRARKRYVPVVDWLVVAVVAGVAGLGVGLLRAPSAPRVQRTGAYDDDEAEDAEEPEPPPNQPRPAPPAVARQDEPSAAQARAAQREREREERARRRSGGR